MQPKPAHNTQRHNVSFVRSNIQNTCAIIEFPWKSYEILITPILHLIARFLFCKIHSLFVCYDDTQKYIFFLSFLSWRIQSGTYDTPHSVHIITGSSQRIDAPFYRAQSKRHRHTHTLSECQLHSRSSEWTNMHIVECAHSTQITLTIGIDEWQKAPGDREQRVFPCNKDHNSTRKTMTESITMSWILLLTDVFVHDDARSRCGLVHAQQWRFDADERRHFARTTTDRSVQLSVSSLRPQNATTAYAMRTLCVCHLQ